MNRTDRLYALVEELRARAPRRVTARELAARFEVSCRTIERDIGALQQGGVPIYADVGRSGGYTLDKDRTLPPLNFTPSEAVAVAVALDRAEGSPFAASARTALQKIVTAMSATDSASARELAARIRFLSHPETDEPLNTDEAPGSTPRPPTPQSSTPAPRRTPTSAVLEESVRARRVVRLAYVDAEGAATDRVVEPVAFSATGDRWYFIAWCRLRRDVRVFRPDRVRRAVLLDEIAPDRRLEDHLTQHRFVTRPLEFV
ncbi:helix-turn-helix transcriptional regulator [Spirillospora sp. CA-294931]|uniref:helix-turn-helix transcriptional regulator n=1 Tax=Spirillospora sp. CA-294931 TaxID=3240042 RepID=UPI003D89DDBA